MSTSSISLGELYVKRSSVDPSKYSDESFDLFSVPAYEKREPDILVGSDIGSSKVSVEPGDTLLCRIVPHIRRAWVVPSGGQSRQIASGEWIILRHPEVDPNYLRQLLLSNSFHSKFMSTVAGVGGSLMRARAAHAASIRIPLPPLPDQRRIADILDRADNLRAQRRRTISRLDSLEDAIFVERFGDPVRNDDRWERVPLSELGASRLGKMLDAKAQTGKNPKKYLRNANVQWFRFDLDHVLEMDFDPRIQAEYRLEPGDVLICEGGQPGRSAIWRGEIEECYFQKALHRVRLDNSKLLPEYFVRYMWLLSRDASFGGLVTSATIAHLTGEKLARLPIVVPPMDLQWQYFDQTEAIDRIRLNQLSALVNLDELFASLQHRAFRGEL